jgi:hypothetical protein
LPVKTSSSAPLLAFIVFGNRSFQGATLAKRQNRDAGDLIILIVNRYVVFCCDAYKFDSSLSVHLQACFCYRRFILLAIWRQERTDVFDLIYSLAF